jgi:hypothetical protein
METPPLKQHKENTMRIGIIGAENMGATLAAQLTRNRPPAGAASTYSTES